MCIYIRWDFGILDGFSMFQYVSLNFLGTSNAHKHLAAVVRGERWNVGHNMWQFPQNSRFKIQFLAHGFSSNWTSNHLYNNRWSGSADTHVSIKQRQDIVDDVPPLSHHWAFLIQTHPKGSKLTGHSTRYLVIERANIEVDPPPCSFEWKIVKTSPYFDGTDQTFCCCIHRFPGQLPPFGRESMPESSPSISFLQCSVCSRFVYTDGSLLRYTIIWKITIFNR
jgi:hypothetical protein